MNKQMNAVATATALSSLLLVGALTWGTPVMATAQPLDQIAVVVNDELIMRSEVNARMRLLQKSSQQAGSASSAQLANQALEELVLERLQLQHAKQTGLTINDAMLDEVINNIAKQNKMNLPTFQAALYRQGINYTQFRQQTRNRMTVDRLRRNQARRQVRVSSGEINNLVSAQSASLSAGQNYQLQHLFIPIAAGASVAMINEARRSAYQQRKQLLDSGEKNTRDQGSGRYSGWQSAETLPVPLLRALVLMERGEISDVVRDTEGFHVVRLLELRGEQREAGSGDELRAKASRFLGEQKSDDYYNAWLQSLRNGAYIDYRMKPATPQASAQ